jgi:hypothetical protein
MIRERMYIIGMGVVLLPTGSPAGNPSTIEHGVVAAGKKS